MRLIVIFFEYSIFLHFVAKKDFATALVKEKSEKKLKKSKTFGKNLFFCR